MNALTPCFDAILIVRTFNDLNSQNSHAQDIFASLGEQKSIPHRISGLHFKSKVIQLLLLCSLYIDNYE